LRVARSVVWIPQARRGDWRVGPHAGKTGGRRVFRGSAERLPRLPPDLSKRAVNLR
jgi:hypothetical protein